MSFLFFPLGISYYLFIVAIIASFVLSLVVLHITIAL